MNIDWLMLKGNTLNVTQLHDILMLRNDGVIIKENNSNVDIDGLDLLGNTMHIIGYHGGYIVTYARLLQYGHESEPTKIERIIVSKKFRGIGFVNRIFKKAIDVIIANL